MVVLYCEYGNVAVYIGDDAMRTASQVMREMALVKSTCKGDPETFEVLMRPLKEELKLIARVSAVQGELAFNDKEKAVKK